MDSQAKAASTPASGTALLATAVLLAACGQRAAQQTPQRGTSLPDAESRSALRAASGAKTVPVSTAAVRWNGASAFTNVAIGQAERAVRYCLSSREIA